MSDSKINNKRIAKNTVLLYSRMILVLLVTLYTSRVILKSLGVVDYGINNVVGGVVVMFGFLNSAMSSATQRYISFALGKGDKNNIRAVFGTSLLIHYIIAAAIFVLSEVIGLWLLNTQMNIPTDRIHAATIVFHCSIVSFIINVTSVPYNATIVSHERMNVYAIVGILEVVLKLAVAFILLVGNMDRLILFALLNLGVTIIIRVIYMLYCRRNFEESSANAFYEKSMFKEMFSFASWNMIGNMAYALRMQGSNILLNMFFGPVVNAARGVAHQVDGAVEQFVTNLQTAANPQIVKSYAVKDYHESINLTQRISKFSFFLVLVLAMPIIFNVDRVLGIWLGDVPEYTSIFTIIILINGLVDSVSKPIKTLIKATGNVKSYMIVQGGWYLFALPVIYLFLSLGYGPVSSVIVLLVFTTIGTFIRLVLTKKVTTGFSIRQFIINVLLPTTITTIVSITVCWLLAAHIDNTSIVGLCARVAVVEIVTLITVTAIGFTKTERLLIFNIVKKIICKKKI